MNIPQHPGYFYMSEPKEYVGGEIISSELVFSGDDIEIPAGTCSVEFEHEHESGGFGYDKDHYRLTFRTAKQPNINYAADLAAYNLAKAEYEAKVARYEYDSREFERERRRQLYNKLKQEFE